MVYRWSLTTNAGGTMVSLNAAGDPISGNSFETPNDQVTYVPTREGTATLAVEAIQVTPAPRTTIGNATASLRVIESQIELTPRKISLRKGESKPFRVSVPVSFGNPQIEGNVECLLGSGRGNSSTLV